VWGMLDERTYRNTTPHLGLKSWKFRPKMGPKNPGFGVAR